MTVVAMVPLMGGLAIGVDYTEMTRQRQNALNALDAAGVATAQQIVAGASDTDAKAYAKNFFEANLAHIDPANTTLAVTLPNNNAGGGTLKLCSTLTYKPYFLPTAKVLVGGSAANSDISFGACSEVRLKNTLEVSLVLDNSGSMTELGKGSNKVRFDLLKDAAKQSPTRSSSASFPSPHRSMSARATLRHPGWTPPGFRRSITRISTGRA